MLDMMEVNHLIENDFHRVLPRQTLAELVQVISQSKRNIFPVVNEEGVFKGHILLDDIRTIMFDTSLYSKSLENIMVFPDDVIHPDDPMDMVAEKFQDSGKYNIVVLDNGKYMGYISRANVFATYRKKLSELSLP